jgi:tyrosine-protein kinase Etk/Wzc
MSGALTSAGRGGHDLTPGAARTVAAGADVVDLGELAQAVRRGWRGIALAALLGAAAAGAVVAWAPRRYEGAATVLLRSSQDAGGSLLGRLGVPAELAPGGLGSALKSPMETELEILASRSVLGAVSDSLGLQVRVLSPKGRPSWSLLAPHPYPGSFRKLRLTLEREGAGYRVRGRGVDGVVTSGAPLATPVGTLVLAPGALPSRFEVQLLDREDALERLGERVSVENRGARWPASATPRPTPCRPPRCPTRSWRRTCSAAARRTAASTSTARSSCRRRWTASRAS